MPVEEHSCEILHQNTWKFEENYRNLYIFRSRRTQKTLLRWTVPIKHLYCKQMLEDNFTPWLKYISLFIVTDIQVPPFITEFMLKNCWNTTFGFAKHRPGGCHLGIHIAVKDFVLPHRQSKKNVDNSSKSHPLRTLSFFDHS